MTHRLTRYARVACLALAFSCGPRTPSVAAAQEAASTPVSVVVTPAGAFDELVLRDGTRAYGRVERIEGDDVVFRTAGGTEMRVRTPDITAVRPADGTFLKGKYRRADPAQTRLFFGPTGRSLKKGTAYVGVYEVVLPFVQVGLTDRISLGAGTPLFFSEGSWHPFWVTPKVQLYSSRSTHVSAGVLHFLNIGDGNLGIAYAVATQGSADSAVTAGIGYAYERSYHSGSGAPVAMIGGEHRATRGMKLITENYIFTGGAILTGGVRWIGEHVSTDLALAAAADDGGPVFFPMVNVVYAFSK